MNIKVKKKSHIELFEIRNNYRRVVTQIKDKRSGLLKIAGVCCVVVGVATFWIPATTIPLIVAGLGCFGVSVAQAKHYSFITTWKIRRGVVTREWGIKLLLLKRRYF